MSLEIATLQVAVVARLLANSELMAVVTGVFDRLPEDTSYPQPFVTVSTNSPGPWSTNTERGAEVELMVDVVYDRPTVQITPVPVQQIMKQIDELLDRQEDYLPLDEATLVLIERISQEIIQDSQGLGYDGVLEYRCLVQDN